jgi:penicillin-binding protein 1C
MAAPFGVMLAFLKKRGGWLVAGLLLLGYYWLLPDPLFRVPYSTVLTDRSGQLLSASIATDGQWRFPMSNPVPEKFARALVLFEDKRFYYHPGVDVLSLARALKQNVSEGKVVSGGSTLTMQVIRLARQQRHRSLLEKLIEAVMATRLELGYSKEEIINLYAAHAPFGGNVVGLEAACWRYFGRQPAELSWAEAALLAVLPNNPSLINLQRNRDLLRAKRDRLLRKIRQQNWIDNLTLQLAMDEALPERPQPMPRIAPHLLDRAQVEGHSGKRMSTTLHGGLQRQVTDVLAVHAQRLQGNQIHNAAALVVDVSSGNVLAYVGNAATSNEHHPHVDVVRAPRSTGSILKPFLYAAMLNEGTLLPTALLPDVPTVIQGFSPKNFSLQYDGAVAADQALIRSLNIPAVYELREYRYEKFYNLLKSLGITTLTQPADHFGLSLILGGAEATLWDVTGVYASMARTLRQYFTNPGQLRYRPSDFHAPQYLPRDSSKALPAWERQSHLQAGAIWLTFDVLKELYRPGEESGWRHFESAKQVAWKTGTSFGFRDGWAVGVNGAYAVGVWVGNADGEGRPGLTGTDAAAPILFDIFSHLPGQAWFEVPNSELVEIEVCAKSGWRASDLCSERKTQLVTRQALSARPCTYHRRVHLSQDGKHQLHANCANLHEMQTASWFVLPPVQEYYYRQRNSSYHQLPPYRPDCVNPAAVPAIDLIYPRWQSRIFLPRALDGAAEHTVFQAVHRDPAAIIHWHLDGQYLGSTQKSHKWSLRPTQGAHLLTLVDAAGETLERPFFVVSPN